MKNTINLMTRKLIIITFSAVLFVSTSDAQQMPGLPLNQLVVPNNSGAIKFKWKGDSVNASWEPYAYLLIPVKLSGCPKTFFMQFDTGTPSSIFYKSKIRSIALKYPKAIQMTDTSSYLQSVSFKAGDISVFAKQIAVRQKTNAGINWSDKQGIQIIGTIGTDFIENKVFVIDYPKQKMLMLSEISGKLRSRVTFSDFMFTRRSVLLPAVIKGKKSMLFFDSGASAYELLTDKKTARSFPMTDTIPVTYPVPSWDRVLTASTFSIRDSIEMNNQKIPLHHATYMEGVGASQVEQMMRLGIGGMTGNKIFLGRILILDTKANKFGIIQ